jgi:hypothetical protein
MFGSMDGRISKRDFGLSRKKNDYDLIWFIGNWEYSVKKQKVLSGICLASCWNPME